MNRLAWLVALSTPLASLWACTDGRSSTGGCGMAADCKAGEVCVANQCTRVCRSDVDCDTGAHCVDDTCQEGTRPDASAPIITAIDGDQTGSSDGATDHTAHHTTGRLQLVGSNFDGAAVDLVDGTTATPLEICSATSSKLVVVLPTTLVGGRSYGIRVYNQAGECNATLPVLQGEPGDQGLQGIQGVQGIAGVAGAKGDAGGGIVLDLELDETGTGVSSFADSSPFGSGRNAVGVGGFTGGATGRSGRAVAFSGTGVVWVQSPNVPDGAQIWVEAWIKPNPPLNVERTLVGKNGAYRLALSSRQLSFTVTGTGSGSPCTVTTLNQPIDSLGAWYHVAGWYDGNWAVVSVNSAIQASTRCSVGPVAPSPSGPFVVGASYNGSTVTDGFDGSIDEIRVRQTAPLAAENQLVARGIADSSTAPGSQYAASLIPHEQCTGLGCILEIITYDENGNGYGYERGHVHFDPATNRVAYSYRDGSRWLLLELGSTATDTWWWLYTSYVGVGECYPMTGAGTCTYQNKFAIISYYNRDAVWRLYKIAE
jgi:hypothetical protein